MRPLISIVVPVYNVEKYVCECLDSILRQKFDDYEIVCIDDGSKDGSLDLLRQYESKDKRVKVITQKNMGLSAARNTGLEYSTGRYVMFVDSDDLLVDEALYDLSESLLSYSVQIIYYNTAKLIYENGVDRDFSKEEYYRVRNIYPDVKTGREHLTELIENDDFVDSACLALIEKDWLEKNGIHFVPGAYYEDSIFILECFFRAKTVHHMNRGLYLYRIRKNSIMTEKYSFANLKWRLWQFSECLRMLYSYELDEREKDALTKYSRQIMANINYIYKTLSNGENIDNQKLDSIANLLVDVMGLTKSQSYNADLEMEGLLSEICKADRIVLYGAGIVGDKLYRILKVESLDKKIIGYATTNKSSIEKKNGYLVKQLEDFSNNEVDILIISSSRYQNDMLRFAEERGFKKIFVITHDIENAIDRYINSHSL